MFADNKQLIVNKQKPKKILIVDNSSWNIYNFRLPLVKRLKSEGYEIIVATPVDEYIQYLNETHFNRHIQLNSLFRQGKNPLRDLAFLFELIRIYRDVRPQLVLHFTIKPSIYGSIAARYLRIPVISVLTGLGYTFVHPYGFNRMIPLIMKLAFSKINKLVVYNSDDQQVLTDKKIISKTQCVIAPGDGVDASYFRLITEHNNTSSFVYLFIGRLLRDKGIEEYVAAAKKIKQIIPATEFWVVGDLNFGNPTNIGRGQLLEWIENQDIKYFATTKDIRAYIQQCNVLVLPSYREGLPRVILEAMSMGKPIITTDTAGCREAIVHGENGLIVPIRDAKALAEAMMAFRTYLAGELEEIGQRNRKRVMAYYATEKSTDKFLALVKEVLGENIEKVNFAKNSIAG